MKKAILFIVFLFIGIITFSQNENGRQIQTLVGNQRISSGGYGAVSFYYSKISGEDVLLIGGKGGWIINHKLCLGLAGYGFVNDLEFDDLIVGKSLNLSGGYGGLLIEPIISPYDPIHISVPLLIGAGGITYFENNWWKNKAYPSKAFFVFEPGVELELNIIRFMRIALGVSYRLTSNIGIENIDSNNLDGFSGGITLKFGKF